MKTISKLLLLASLLVLSSCGFVKKITPKGPVTKVEHYIAGFSELRVSSGMYVEVTMGDTESVEIEAKEELHQYIEVFKDGDELRIKLKEGVWFSMSGRIIVRIGAKRLDEITGSGGTEFYIQNAISTSDLEVTLSGGSSLESEVNCSKMGVVMSGGSRVKLKGMTGIYELVASGGSSSNGYELIIDNFDGQLSGGSKAKHTVNSKIDVSVSGGSAFSYKGDGVINSKSVSGGSEVYKR